MISIPDRAGLKKAVSGAALAVLLALAWLALWPWPAQAQQPRRTPQVLILNSYHQGEAWSDNELAGILPTLAKAHPSISPLIEHLDAKRFSGPAHLEFLRRYLSEKYAGRRFDLIMALDNSALDLLLAHRQQIFPGQPVVFAGVNGFTPQMIAGQADITGVEENQDIAGTLRLIMSLQPQVRQVYVIHDYTASGLALHQAMERVAPQFSARLGFRHSPDLPFNQLAEELKRLPADAAAVILTYVTDQAGRTFTREESTRLISQACPVPVYAMHETRLGHGIVGGLLLEGKEHGAQAARLALDILGGKDASSLPVAESVSRPVFDFRQLERFGIPAGNLPPDSVVINRPISLWERHQKVLLPTSGVVAVLLALLLLLAMALKRLGQAQRELGKSREEYRLVVENSGEAITVAQKGLPVFFNSRAPELAGVSAQEFARLPIMEHFHPQARAMAGQMFDRALRGENSPLNFDFRMKDLDGQVRWAHISSVLINWQGSPAFLSFLSDISERKRAELTLGENERRYRMLLESVTAVPWEAEIASLRFTFMGRQIEQMLGYPAPSWLEPEAWAQRLHPEDGPRAMDFCREAAAQGENIDFIHRMIAADGQPHWIHCFVGVVAGEAGPEKLVGFMLDVTHHQEVEEANRRWANVFAHAEWGIAVSSSDSRRLEQVNPAFARMHGYSVEELKGSPIADIFAPECRADLVDHISAAHSKGHHSWEARHLRKDGSSFPVLIGVTAVRGDQGQVLYRVANVLDISDRLAAEQALRDSEERFRALVENAPEAIFVQRQGRFAYVNQGAMELFGANRAEELLGHPVAERLHPDHRSLAADRIEQINVLKRKAPVLEQAYLRLDGGQVEVSSSAVPIRYEDEEGALVFARDIGERRQAEQEKAKLMAQLHQAQKMEAIGTLAGGVAHDFNNILAAVVGFSELALEQTKQGQDNSDDIAQILVAAERARGLVRQILTYSRKTSMEMKPLDMNAMVREASHLLKRTLPKMINITTDLAADLPLVNADAHQMLQVLMNLSGNAADAMPQGGSLVIATLAANLENQPCPLCHDIISGGHVLLKVTDNGSGMEQATLAKIFDPFFTTKEVGKGTGLGLSTVYGIVESHGGHINVESQPGQGSTFSIYLPAAPKLCLAPAGQETPAVCQPVLPGTILVADDEPSIRALCSRMLEAQGHRVLQADNGEEALRIFTQERRDIDLVVLDLGMPGMGGLACLRAMLEMAPGVRIIIASGYAGQDQVKEALDAGASGYVAKPYKRDELLHAVAAQLGAGKS